MPAIATTTPDLSAQETAALTGRITHAVLRLSQAITARIEDLDAINDWEQAHAVYQDAIESEDDLAQLCTAVSLLAASNPRALATEIASCRRTVARCLENMRSEHRELQREAREADPETAAEEAEAERQYAMGDD